MKTDSIRSKLRRRGRKKEPQAVYTLGAFLSELLPQFLGFWLLRTAVSVSGKRDFTGRDKGAETAPQFRNAFYGDQTRTREPALWRLLNGNGKSLVARESWWAREDFTISIKSVTCRKMGQLVIPWNHVCFLSGVSHQIPHQMTIFFTPPIHTFSPLVFTISLISRPQTAAGRYPRKEERKN